jgi:hypothetical protein
MSNPLNDADGVELHGQINIKQFAELLGMEPSDTTRLANFIRKHKTGQRPTYQEVGAAAKAFVGLVDADQEITNKATIMLKRVDAEKNHLPQESVNEGIRVAKEGIEECWDDMGGQEMTTGENGEQMSVTISMPGKNISVTTDSAEEIGNILRLAGINIGGAGASGDVDGDGDHDLGDHAAELSLPGTTGTGGEEPVIYVGAGPNGGGEAEYGDQPSDSPLTTNAGNTDSYSDDAEEEEIKDDSEETKEAVGDKSYTSKGGTVTQTATGLKHQAGSGTYGGTETDDEEKARKEAEQEMAKKELPEAAGAVNFDKVLDAIAALYGDDMWNNDSMQDLAHELEQQKPTEQELDSIIATGELPQRLANTQFTNNDSVQFGEAARILQLAGITNEAQSAAQKAAFAKMIAAKKGNKSEDKADKKDDNKKPDADNDGIPDWADKDKEVKEEAPAGNSIYGQSVYEAESEAARILALSGVAEGRLMNSPDGTSMPEPKTYDSLPSRTGLGGGNKDYGLNRADGQGENPMGMHTNDVNKSVDESFAAAMGEYRKFVAENISRKK